VTRHCNNSGSTVDHHTTRTTAYSISISFIIYLYL